MAADGATLTSTSFALESSPLPLLLIVGMLALVPFLMLGATSYLKLSIVFGILRNAIGAQQIPSAALTSLLALALTLRIMAPVGSEIGRELQPILSIASTSPRIPVPKLLEVLSRSQRPLTNFLVRHSRMRERLFFAGIESPASNFSETELLPGESVLSLIPAFMLSELQAAFAIGVVLFLPFIVIDLVVANLLVGLGLNMVSPAAFSLPLKLLLFAGCDAWFLLSRSLVLSYGGA